MSVAMTPRGVGVPRELSIKVVVNGPMLFELSPWLGRSSSASLSGLNNKCLTKTFVNKQICHKMRYISGPGGVPN